MQPSKFICVGENIHCTRIFKVGGINVKPQADGRFAITYKGGRETRQLPVPEAFTKTADWEAGKVKHCVVAIWQGNYGRGPDREAGVDYLRMLARSQVEGGANYLDINVDEFSTDLDERKKMIRWTVDVAQKAVPIPMSIDSSNTAILRAGLEACDASRGRPMVNSVSLERADAIEAAREFRAVVIASAAGAKGMPSGTEERLTNFAALMPRLRAAGFAPEAIHLDPLVFPISVDGGNGKRFLDAVAGARKTYGPAVHIIAGLSNVSFGMPSRKLINQVFTWLALEAGADGGIVDPSQISLESLKALDTKSKGFQLARALLLGEDEFGMNFIAASREGEI